MMIRNLRHLLKAYWKEQTKGHPKQNKSRLLIYDEHLKRFVSADELLIPNETFKVKTIDGPIKKRKSRDLLYDILLKKFVNMKLDMSALRGIDGCSFCKIDIPQKICSNLNTSNKDFFWGKKYSGKKHRVPALPPIDKKLPTKEEEMTNTGWAGQRTDNPETDPRPELRTSGDCPSGPGKRPNQPDKKKPPKKNNAEKRFMVCAKESKTTEKAPYNSITTVAQSKSMASVSSTISKPKAQHSIYTENNSQGGVIKKEDPMKSSVLISERHNNDLSVGHTKPCQQKKSETVTTYNFHSGDLTKGNAVEKLQRDVHYNRTRVLTKNPSSKHKCISNELETPDIELKYVKTRQVMDESGKISGRLIPKYQSSKICASSKNDTDNSSCKNNVGASNSNCKSIASEHQNQKIRKILTNKNVEKDSPNNNTKCDSTCYRDVNKNIFPEVIATELESKTNESSTSKNNDKNEQIRSSFNSKCDPNRKLNDLVSDNKVCEPTVKGLPQKGHRCNSNSNANLNCSKQADLCNDYSFTFNEGEKFTKTVLKRGLEFGLKRAQEPTTLCCPEINSLNDTTKSECIGDKEADEALSSQSCISSEKSGQGRVDSQVAEKLEAINQDKCLDELSNELSKINSPCYVGFKIKKTPDTQLSDKVECKDKILNLNSKQAQGENNKTPSSKNKVHKPKIKGKNKGGKKICSKEFKTNLQKDQLGKGNIKEVICKKLENHETINKNDCKAGNVAPENHVVKINKYKLQTTNTFSSNMSSRHSEKIIKKLKRDNFKNSPKDKTTYTILPHLEGENLCEHIGLGNKKEINNLKLIKEDQLRQSSQTSINKKTVAKNIHDCSAEKKPPKTKLKKRQSSKLQTAKICSKKYPSNIRNKVVSKPNNTKINKKSTCDQNNNVGLKGLPYNSVSANKSLRKSNICQLKNVSNQSSTQKNKFNTKTNLSDNYCEVPKNVTKYTLLSKLNSLAALESKKEKIRPLNGLNLHNGGTNTLSVQANPLKLSKSDGCKSEIGSYKKNKSPKAMKNTVTINGVNQANSKKDCNREYGRNSHESLSLASTTPNKTHVPLQNSMKNSSFTTTKIKEPHIVSIKAYTHGNDMAQCCKNPSFNPKIKLPFFTKYIAGSPASFEESSSQSAIAKSLINKKSANKSKSLTKLSTGNDKISAIVRKGKMNMDQNNLNVSSQRVILNTSEAKNTSNFGPNCKQRNVNKIETRSKTPINKYHSGIKVFDDIKINKNGETDRQLNKLARKNPLIRNNIINKEVSLLASKAPSSGSSQASSVSQKGKVNKTSETLKKSSLSKSILKSNVPLKVVPFNNGQLKEQMYRNANSNKITAVIDPLVGSKIPKPSVLKANTFIVQSSKIKKNILKTRTFTIASSRSHKENGQRVKCSIKKPVSETVIEPN